MAWQDEMTTMLRYMLGDITEGKLVYSDDTLQNTILVGAIQVGNAVAFEMQYSASLSSGLLTPDPTFGPGKNTWFMDLVTLKAASILDRTEATLAARRAIIVRDGSSAIDLSKVADAKIRLLEKGWIAAYDDAVFTYQYQRTQNISGAAIMTPFRLYAQGGYSHTTLFGGGARGRENYLL